MLYLIFIRKVKNDFNNTCYVFHEAIIAYQIARYLVFSWLEESVIRYNCIKYSRLKRCKNIRTSRIRVRCTNLYGSGIRGWWSRIRRWRWWRRWCKGHTWANHMIYSNYPASNIWYSYSHPSYNTLLLLRYCNNKI